MKKVLLLGVFLIGVLLVSCDPKEVDPSETTEKPENSVKQALIDQGEKEIVLGAKIENPYSVENMRKAYENLMSAQNKGSSNILRRAGESINISTNHHYVRFWCDSVSDKDKLSNLDIEFSDFPLDREISEKGEFFMEEDTSTQDYKGSWVYTSLSKDFDYKSVGLKHEILEDLFLFEQAQAGDEEEDQEDRSVLSRATNNQVSFYQ